MTRKQNVFEQYVKGGAIDLPNLRSETIGDFLDFLDKNTHINYFTEVDEDTSNSIKFERSRNINNNMKLRRIGAAIGL